MSGTGMYQLVALTTQRHEVVWVLVAYVLIVQVVNLGGRLPANPAQAVRSGQYISPPLSPLWRCQVGPVFSLQSWLEIKVSLLVVRAPRSAPPRLHVPVIGRRRR